MLSLNEIQAAVITRLKANAPLVAALGAGGVEVRESQWQGNEFVYPCVRVRAGPLLPGATGCPYRSDIGVVCFSEHASSQEAVNLAALVSTALDDQRFTDSTQQVRFAGIWLVEVLPPVRRDLRTWAVEVRCRCLATET